MNEQINEQIERKETYEEKKAARNARREAQNTKYKRPERTRKFGWGILSIVIIALLVWWGVSVTRNQEPLEDDLSVAVEIMTTTHIEVGSALPEYTSNPPSSGPHYGTTARSAFRDEEIPDQNIIHNLEHGDVWISYRPGATQEILDILKDVAGGKVIVTPRLANDTDIAVVSWGRVDKFNIEEEENIEKRIKDFIARYTNKGPERVPGPSLGV